MSLIKDTLPLTEDLSKTTTTNRTGFKKPLQMLVTSSCSTKKSVVFPINELEKPTIDSVLNTVPLFYNPITKQLILQQDVVECKSINQQQQYTKCNNRRPVISDHHRISNDKVRKLNNLNESLNQLKIDNLNDDLKENIKENLKESLKKHLKNELKCSSLVEKQKERKFLETQLDDFTTKSINLSQHTAEVKLIKDETIVLNKCKIDSSSYLNDEISLEKLNLIQTKQPVNEIQLNNSIPLVNHQASNNNKASTVQTSTSNHQTTNQQQIKKDTYKTHRRTPSYIHDFHNVIKNNNQNQNHQTHSSSITVSSVAAAISNLTKTSLANATSTLSNTITTSKLNDQMCSTNTSPSDSSKVSNKQIVFNESKNELNFYDQDNESSNAKRNNNKQLQQTTSNNKIDDDEVDLPPLDLPSPYLNKPKKLSLITSPFTSVLSKLTRSSTLSNKQHQSVVEHNDKSSNESSRRNSDALLTASTNGLLIFENQRPSNLPNKSADEELYHRLMVDKMIKDAKRKELEDLKQVKKNLVKKKKDEERMTSSIKVWKEEIIPNFDQVKNKSSVKELWSYGLPSNLRGTIWSLAIGNRLNLNNESFDHYLAKWYDSSLDQDDSKIKEDRIVNCLSKCSDESVYELIKLDVSRTFPQLKLFQQGAPFYDKLLKLLGTYVIAYRPDIGYIQGMSFIMGMLLLNMDSKQAFIAFANLLDNSPVLMKFYKLEQEAMKAFYETFDFYFQSHLPELYNHFKEQKLTSELFMIDWIYTLFTKVLPLEISTRVLDQLLRDGEEVIVRASLTILKLFEKQLLENDFINCAQFLTQLSTQSNQFPIDSSKFLTTLTKFNKIKCKKFNSLYQKFNHHN